MFRKEEMPKISWPTTIDRSRGQQVPGETVKHSSVQFSRTLLIKSVTSRRVQLTVLSDPLSIHTSALQRSVRRSGQMRATPGTQSVPRHRQWVQTVVSVRSSEQVLHRVSSGKGQVPKHSHVVSCIGAPVSRLRHGFRNVCLDTSCQETNTIVL